MAYVIGPERALDRAGFSAAHARQVTGIAVTGTAGSPVVYVTSSDPRMTDFATGESPPLDTNSGVVSILDHGSGVWTRRDLVRGLPRSRWDHGTNGLLIDDVRDRLYVAQGGMTNMGAPSARFGNAPEYALSGAILSIDLSTGSAEAHTTFPLSTTNSVLGRMTEVILSEAMTAGTRRSSSPAGPVQLLGTGLRNPYDVVLTRKGLVYTIDNGPDWFWGGAPNVADRRCTNRESEGGRYVADALYVVDEGFYGGHPNPTRSSRAVNFNMSNPPVSNSSAAAEGVPVHAGPARKCPRGVRHVDKRARRVHGVQISVAQCPGDLVAASFDRRVYRVDLDACGRRVIQQDAALRRSTASPST